MLEGAGYKYCKSDYTTVDIGQNSSPGWQLDYIFYRGLDMVNVHVSDDPAGAICSDHKALFATFVLPPRMV